MPSCVICGHGEFIAGPFGRLSERSLAPRCAKCGSLERHRAMRAALDLIRVPELFSVYSLIRFSADPIVDDAWFASAEISDYEGENSLDVQDIDRGDDSYDVVVCSHVVEHVRDDRRAIRELARILSPRGFLLLAYPHSESDLTEDWGFADASKNGHYRGYGNDFDDEYKRILPGIPVVSVTAADGVTGDRKRFRIASKSPFWTAKVLGLAGKDSIRVKSVAP